MFISHEENLKNCGYFPIYANISGFSDCFCPKNNHLWGKMGNFRYTAHSW